MKKSISALIVLALLSLYVNHPSAELTQPSSPVSLTNPDGQAMTLVKYDLRVAVNGPLSLTEMEMVFHNPEHRQMEGRFLYLLPPGATISRFAKEVNGKLMEGEVVEKLRAQSIYTEILHTMRDPALLETDQGNRFSARVFPIPADGDVRLLLGFSQANRTLTIPMAGLPKISDFGFTLVFAPWAGETLTCSTPNGRMKDFTPEKDIVIFSVPVAGSAANEKPRAIKAGNFQMLAYKPQMPFKDGPPQKSTSAWAFYFDTSASNADDELRRLSSIDTLLTGMVLHLREGESTFSAYAFDVNIVPLFPATSMNAKGGKPFMPQVTAALRARHALGATHLANTLKHIGEQARAGKADRFVLVSDGIATLGPREARDIVAALGDWPQGARLDALVLGNKQDEKMLKAIVEKTNGRVMTLPFGEKLQAAATNLLPALQIPMGETFEFYDEGAAWIYPKTFRDVHNGDELIVFSQLKDGAASKPGVVESGDRKSSEDFKLTPVEMPDFAPLLQREANRAFLDHLEKCEQAEENAAKRAEFHKQRIDVSVKNRVLCPLTSLLVLETENDYRRFGIERTALADVMIVGEKGIELRKRAPDEVPPPIAMVRGGKKRELADKAQAAPTPARAGEAHPVADAPRKQADDEKPGQLGFARGLAEESKESGATERLDQLQEAGANDFGGATRGLRQAGTERLTAAASAAPASPAAASTTVRDAAPAEQAVESRRRNANGDRAAGNTTTTKIVAPDWTKQFGAVPSEEELNALRSKVQGAPRDRNLRNAYADALFKAKQWDSLQGQVFEWLPFDPENPQVFEYLGRSAAGLNDPELALRAYTSIAEVAPNRAALLSRAGWLLLATKKYEMADEMFREALKNRQDDCNIYRGLAMSLWLRKDFDKAAGVLEEALKKDFNARYGDVKRVMSEELGYIFRAWMNSGAPAANVAERAAKFNLNLKRNDAFRATLCWETDASDVDLHVVDPNGEECFYSHKNNASGLELYSDQTQGLGPEVVRCDKAISGTYHVGVNYFNAGAMGVSRGIVVIMQPKDGIVEEPVIAPFCLIPGGPDMRHLGAAKY